MGIIKFLKSDKKFLNQGFGFFEICRLLPIIFLYILPLGALVEITYKIFGIAETDNAIFQYVESSKPILFLFFAGFVGPILEESGFRLAMVNTKNNFSFGGAMLVIMIFKIIFNFSDNWNSLQTIGFYGTIFCFLVYFLRIIYDKRINFAWTDFNSRLPSGKLLPNVHKTSQSNTNKINFNQNKIFWVLTILFGTLHIFNMESVKQIWFLAPVLCLPQIGLGIILGYLRLNYSFLTSVFFHILWNSFLTSTIFLAKENTNPVFVGVASLFFVMFLIGIFLNLKNLIKQKST